MLPAIRVENLGKRYRISHAQTRGGYRTLRESLVGAASAPLRRLRGARPKAEDFWALNDVSFDVQPGEVVGIIGRNGAGKSTLLKILSRITKPTTGRVRLRGRVGSLLEVGTGFHPELTGRENIFLNGSILGMSRREIARQFDEIVDFAGIEKFLETPVKRYSSGMYVRLAFAVAAHLEPEILIIDEVLAVGDASFQKKCLNKMGEVAEAGRTVLFVSHNLAALAQLCDRAIWVESGRTQMQGETASVLNSYLRDGSSALGTRRWNNPVERPGDDRVRLIAGSICQNGKPTTVVDINEPTEVQIEFEALDTCVDLVTGVSFYNQEGLCLSNSCDWRPCQVLPGVYRKSVSIPRCTFAEGRVDVLLQLVFFDPDVRSVVVPNAMSFDCVDSQSEYAVRGAYKGAWPGVVRLGFNWSQAFASSAGESHA